MKNIEIYQNAFVESLSVDKIVNEKLEYGSVLNGSIAYGLISELDKFSISIETDDVIDFSSFEKGKEILKKYKINV